MHLPTKQYKKSLKIARGVHRLSNIYFVAPIPDCLNSKSRRILGTLLLYTPNRKALHILHKILYKTIRFPQAIASLPDVERLLMRYRYIDGLNWIDVAAKMNYSWQGTHKIHARALKRLLEQKE